MRLLATYPPDGAGLDCGVEAGDCGVPRDATIELRFDRFLQPATVVRQSLEVRTGAVTLFLQPEYDAVERVAVYHLTEGEQWEPGARYVVTLWIADEHSDGWGFRAFDGAGLDRTSPAPIEFTFRTRRAAPSESTPKPEVTWQDMAEALEREGCASSQCHRAPDPRMALDLGDVSGVERTALGQVAHQTEAEPDAAEPYANPDRFGLQMPILDEGRPANSYLLYKVLVNRDSYQGVCDSVHQVELDGCVAFPAEDAGRLREWFVSGAPMPLVERGSRGELSIDDMRSIQRWIAEGAPTD